MTIDVDARLTLVAIPTETAPLDGLLYEPTERPVRGSVLLMHGNVGNFYTGLSRLLPPYFVRLGLACLSFNRRGHDILVNRVGREPEGGAYQTAQEGLADNVFAARFLERAGYARPTLVGHSNGGMLAAQLAADDSERVSALVLLSAHAGGPDTYARSCASGLMADDEAAEFERRARSLVAAGRGEELMLMPRWWYVISASSLVDRMDRTPSLLDAAPAVRCPTLTVRGGLESPHTYPMEEFAARTSGPAQCHVVEGADHWYGGHERELAQVVSAWLDARYDEKPPA